MRTCEQCRKKEFESSVRYYKRTKLSYDSPFICLFCERVLKLDKSPGESDEKLRKHLEVLENNRLRKLEEKTKKESLKLSPFLLMRKMKIDFNRAEQMINTMTEENIWRMLNGC